MKKIFALLLVLAMVLSMAACAPSTTNPTEGNDNVDLSGTYKITMWVSESEGVADQFKDQIAEFNKTNGQGIVIEAQIEGVSEANAGSQVLADVASAPDIYCFAQDQLARLVQASALLPLGKGAAATITANNDAGSVAAGTVAGTLYAYPMTSDNGYYMYYDKSIISEEEALDLAAIVAKCEANNKKFRFALENGWYVASFFFATGCHTNWTTNENGDFVSVDDTFNSEAGMIAMKGMQILAKSTCYDSNADIFTDAGVVVTGIWNATAAADHFGENLGATKLPSFTVDGQTYQLGSYSGYKLMGVKPQADGKKAAVLSLLAQFLTNEECQMKRYEGYQWGPSNLNAQASEAVQANPSLAALAKQGAYGVPQGQIHGAWWDIAKVLGADAKNATSEEDLKAALVSYEEAITALFSMTEEQKNAWSVIGNICGTSWDTDFAMTETETKGTYLSEVLELHAGEEFKCRQGAAWDVNFGVEFNGANVVVEADGKYQVQLVWDGAQTGTITLIPAE